MDGGRGQGLAVADGVQRDLSRAGLWAERRAVSTSNGGSGRGCPSSRGAGSQRGFSDRRVT